MLISVASANYFFLPFPQALEIIARAGIRHIELDLYWTRGKWTIAQHLRDVSTREAVRLVRQSGLKVANIHDGGGVIEDADSLDGFVNPRLAEYLDELGYAPGCIVFHTPHIEGSYDMRWWHAVSGRIAGTAAKYQGNGTVVTVENMPPFEGFYVPLATPEELLAFAREYDLGITLDTTHYAQAGVDIKGAARILKGKVVNVHLGDYADGKSHVFVGDGGIDFSGFLRELSPSVLRSMTFECSPVRMGEDALELTPQAMSERLRMAQARLHTWLSGIPELL